MLAYELVGGWRLDEASETTRYDVLGRTPLLVPVDTFVPANEGKIVGKSSQHTNFLGTGGFLGASSVSLLPQHHFTLACWVKRTGTTSAVATVLGQAYSSVSRSICLTTTFQPRFVYNTSANHVTTGTILAGGVWNHLAMTYDASGTAPRFCVYQNGILLSVSNITAGFGTGSLVAIGIVGAGTVVVNVDEAYMWGRALAHGEIADIYRLGNAGVSYPWGDGKSCG